MITPEAVLVDLAGTLDHGARSPWTPEEGQGWREAVAWSAKATRGIPMTRVVLGRLRELTGIHGPNA